MNLTKCPKCGNPTDLSEEACRSCGIIFSKFYKSRLPGFKKTPSGSEGHGKFRLLIDIIMGITGIAMILTGFVILFVSCSGSSSKAVSGDISCIVLGTGSFLSGIVCVVLGSYGIAREIK